MAELIMVAFSSSIIMELCNPVLLFLKRLIHHFFDLQLA